MLRFAAFASEATVSFAEPMHVFIIASIAVASIAGIVLMGAFAMSLLDRRG